MTGLATSHPRGRAVEAVEGGLANAGYGAGQVPQQSSKRTKLARSFSKWIEEEGEWSLKVRDMTDAEKGEELTHFWGALRRRDLITPRGSALLLGIACRLQRKPGWTTNGRPS